MMIALVVLVLLGVVQPSTAQHATRLAFQVEARGKECYFVEVPQEQLGEVLLEVAVVKGGLLDILVEIFDPSEVKMLSRMYFEGKGSNEIKFVAEKAGDYQLCFNNEMARWTAKVVAMRVQLHGAAGAHAQPVKPEDIDPLEKKLETLELTLEKVTQEQVHYKG